MQPNNEYPFGIDQSGSTSSRITRYNNSSKYFFESNIQNPITERKSSQRKQQLHRKQLKQNQVNVNYFKVNEDILTRNKKDLADKDHRLHKNNDSCKLIVTNTKYPKFSNTFNNIEFTAFNNKKNATQDYGNNNVKKHTYCETFKLDNLERQIQSDDNQEDFQGTFQRTQNFNRQAGSKRNTFSHSIIDKSRKNKMNNTIYAYGENHSGNLHKVEKRNKVDYSEFIDWGNDNYEDINSYNSQLIENNSKHNEVEELAHNIRQSMKKSFAHRQKTTVMMSQPQNENTMEIVKQTVKQRNLPNENNFRSSQVKLALNILELLVSNEPVFRETVTMIRKVLENCVIFDDIKYDEIAKILSIKDKNNILIHEFTIEEVMVRLFEQYKAESTYQKNQIQELTRINAINSAKVKELTSRIKNMLDDHKNQTDHHTKRYDTLSEDTSELIKNQQESKKQLEMDLQILREEMQFEKDKIKKEFLENSTYINGITSKYQTRITEQEINEKEYRKTLDDVNEKTKDINHKYQEMFMRQKGAINKMNELEREKEDLHNELIIYRRTTGEPSRTLTPRPDFHKVISEIKKDRGLDKIDKHGQFDLKMVEGFDEMNTEKRMRAFIENVLAASGKYKANMLGDDIGKKKITDKSMQRASMI